MDEKLPAQTFKLAQGRGGDQTCHQNIVQDHFLKVVNSNMKYNGMGYLPCNGYVPCQVIMTDYDDLMVQRLVEI